MASVYHDEVKDRVYKRDNGRCVVCGTSYTTSPCGYYYDPNENGYHTEQNLVTMCMACFCDYDTSPKRAFIRSTVRRYLKAKYKNWNEENLYYHEGGNIDV